MLTADELCPSEVWTRVREARASRTAQLVRACSPSLDRMQHRRMFVIVHEAGSVEVSAELMGSVATLVIRLGRG